MQKSKIIYSLYIDIPDEELDYQPPHWNSTIPKNEYAKTQFKEYSGWLQECQKKYANSCGADYTLFGYDDAYIRYKEEFNKLYPQIVSYNIVNFYKITKLIELCEIYDEVLYLDFDVVPISDLNFFEHHDFNAGIHIMNGTAESQEKARVLNTVAYSNRSPAAKYCNARAMCMFDDLPGDHDVFNTGIVGANKHYMDQLDYYGNFKQTLELMTEVKEDTGVFPPQIQEMFGYDNETIWAYKTIKNKVPFLKLDPKWHHFMDKWNYIPKETNLVHMVNKNFGFIKEWMQERG